MRKFSNYPIEFKEEKDKFVSTGCIATTHPDRAADSDDTTEWEGDILPEEMIDRIVDTINGDTTPEARQASYRHDWIKQKDPSLPPAGIAREMENGKRAEKIELPNGHFGAYVETEHTNTYPDREDLISDVKQEVIPGYSIEYIANDYDVKTIDGKNFRVLKDIDFSGYGFANARLQANPKASIQDYGYKELKKVIQMSKEDEKKQILVKEILKLNDKLDKKELMGKEVKDLEDTKKAEEEKAKGGNDPAAKPPADPPTEPPTKPEGEGEEKKVSQKEFEEFEKFKNMKTKLEKKEAADKEFDERYALKIKELQPKDSPFNIKGDKVEMKELDAFKKTALEVKEASEKFDFPTNKEGYIPKAYERQANALKNLATKQFKEANDLRQTLKTAGIDVRMNTKQLQENSELDSAAQERMQHIDFTGDMGPANPYAASPYAGNIMSTKESYWDRFEMKASGLGAMNTTNANVNLAHGSWTYGSMYQSPVELNDIYGPALVNQLNDQTTTWGKLRKENWSGRSQIQFRARTGRNSTAVGYSEMEEYTLSSFSGFVSRDKFQQPFCYYHVLVAVSGQSIQLSQAPGGMGDVWGNELQWSTVDLTKVLNQAILGTGDGTSESVALGFEKLIVGTSGTLYGRDISTFTTLKSHQESVSVRITLDQMRKMVEYTTMGDASSLTNSNAKVSDLAFFTSPRQGRKVKGLIQDMQRTVPTSSRVGFEGTMELDSVPVFEDPDINTDDLFLIDMAHTKLAINLGPTVEFLPIAIDGKAAHVKIYFNLYSDMPTNNYWTSGLST